MNAFRIVAKIRDIFIILASLAVCGTIGSCTVERAEETILATHANGAKKTSIWIYPDGEILKRNEWYSDGIKELEIPYKDGVPHGEFKRWTGFGDLAMIGEYKKGKRNGTWTSYYTANLNSRKKEAVRYYKDDHAIGNWEGWFYNEIRSFEEHYSDNGDSIGIWKKWNEDGTLAEENSCFSTEESGYYRKFNFKGILEFEYYCRHGKKFGESNLYYGDGKKIQIKELWSEDQLSGARTFYYANGKIQKVEFWKDGERDSTWQWFSPEGQLVAESTNIPESRTDFGVCSRTARDSTIQYVICAESTFVSINGRLLLDGVLWFFREGHELRYEEHRSNGQLERSVSFYPDTIKTASGDTIVFKRPASEGFWSVDPRDTSSIIKKDLRHGIWRNWYPNGILRDSLTYINGERVGEQFSYDSTGKLTIHKTENGKNRPVIMHIPQ